MNRSRPYVTGVLLAAGASRRMGEPKALLPMGSGTYFSAALGTLLGGGCDQVVTVLAEPHGRLILAGASQGGHFLMNPEPSRGMASSILEALQHPLVNMADQLVISLIDHPLVRPTTLQQLLRAQKDSGALLVRPQCQGRHGHPYVIGSALLPQLNALPPQQSLRPFFRSLTDSVSVLSEDPGVLADIDTLAQHQALLGLT